MHDPLAPYPEAERPHIRTALGNPVVVKSPRPPRGVPEPVPEEEPDEPEGDTIPNSDFPTVFRTGEPGVATHLSPAPRATLPSLRRRGRRPLLQGGSALERVDFDRILPLRARWLLLGFTIGFAAALVAVRGTGRGEAHVERERTVPPLAKERAKTAQQPTARDTVPAPPPERAHSVTLPDPPAAVARMSPGGRQRHARRTAKIAHRLLRRKKYRRAEHWFLRTLAYQPKSVNAAAGLASAVAGQRGRLEEAEQWARTAIIIDEKSARAYATLGEVLLARKRKDAALTAYGKAAALVPRSHRYARRYARLRATQSG